MESQSLNAMSLTGVARSLANAMQIEAPELSEASNAAMDNLVKHVLGGEKVDRVLMYNPDAVALWLYQKYTHYYLPMLNKLKLVLPLQSVMPSVTPVCFGTMYTGVQPEVHGIRAYVKPVITVDTIFDALLRAGKKPAIVCTEGDSLSKIYLERKMDYYFYPTLEEVNAKALELIEKDEYDFIVVYNGNYDGTMHKEGPEGEPSLKALQHNVDMYCQLHDKVAECWKNHNTLIGFAPDHGCHVIDGGCGSHGLDMPEDLNILHFYDVLPKQA